ncbi:phosphoglycerate kinase [Candidatus Parcubacteria bacterium]|nr:phosphoglycerate kinase [Candidatus Parcubacteria bacterium]
MKILEDFDVNNKRVLVRCDFNVPLDNKGNILDDFRIKQVFPTIRYLLKNKAKIVLISHLGRPTEPSAKYSLKPVGLRLEKLLGRKISFLPDCIGEDVEKEIDKIQSGEIVVLENLRFYKGEEGNAQVFAKQLAKLGDIFIQEAFACCHRSHASIVSLPKYLPSGAGFLLCKELSSLQKVVKNPSRPLVAIIGGIKLKTKIKLVEKLSQICDFILVSSVLSLQILKNKISLPENVILSKDVDISMKTAPSDIDSKTIALFTEKILQAKTIFWNGPLGKIEKKEFQNGTSKIAEKIIESGAYSVIGGGETIEFLKEINLADKFDHISTGGGAMIDYLVDGKLVGIDALNQN